MKKIAISSAFLALMLAACGTNEAAPTTEEPEEQPTAAETSQSNEQQAEQTEEQKNTTTGSSTTDSSTVNGSTNTTNASSSSEETTLENTALTLYASNEDASLIVPFEVQYEGQQEDLVPFIFEKVDVYDTNLVDYSFENEGTSLILNIDDTIFNVQGSTGGTMYVNTLVQSYLDNFPALNDVTFLYNGSSEPVSDHITIGEPYGRGDITNIAQ